MGILKSLFGPKESHADKVQVHMETKQKPAEEKKTLDSIEKKGLIIDNGMIVSVKKDGHYIKAYSNSGVDFTPVVSSSRRKKAWSKKKLLKAKIGMDKFESYRVTWSLTETKEMRKNRRENEKAERKKQINTEQKRVITLKTSIKKLLKSKGVKMPASDIDAHIKHKDVDEIKELCEEMYINGEISRTGNYRYFILTEERKKPKPKKASAPKTEKVDIEKELEILKGLLDKGLITQEMYDAKAKELLGL